MHASLVHACAPEGDSNNSGKYVLHMHRWQNTCILAVVLQLGYVYSTNMIYYSPIPLARTSVLLHMIEVDHFQFKY